MKSKIGYGRAWRVGIIVFCLVISLIPPVWGNGWPKEQTRHIQAPPVEQGKDADMFVSEAGIGLHSELVAVLDPEMDIYTGLFFKDIKLNSYFYLENATLRLHTAGTMDFDADSSFTIYGIPDYRYFGLGNSDSWAFGAPSSIMSAPLTSAYVNYNSSQFYGSQWWDIDITNIVRELQSNPYYEGPGMDFNNPGDNMGFIIFGAGGHDTRYFYDLSAGNGKEAQLHIHWAFFPPSPPELPPNAVFNETYLGREIWFVQIMSNMLDMVYWNGTTERYTEINRNASDVEITGVTTAGNKPSSYQLIRGPDDDIFYLGRVGTDQTLFHSYDEGVTWDNVTLNDQYADLIGLRNANGSLAFDSSGDLWIVWSSNSTEHHVMEYRVVSATVNITDHVLDFSDDVEYIPDNREGWPGASQLRPCIWIDGYDRKHLVHDGPFFGGAYGDQIYYTYKDDGAWTGRELLTNLAPGRDYLYGNIVTSLHGAYIIVVHDSDVPNIGFYYYKGGWSQKSLSETAGVDQGCVAVYNDAEDKALLVWEWNEEIMYSIFNLSDVSLTPGATGTDTGVDGIYPDLTIDESTNEALMVFDAGDDGLQGIVYNFNTESWGSNFTIREINPGYIHTPSRGMIDLEGVRDPLGEWWVFDPLTNETDGPFDELDDAEDFIGIEVDDPEDPNPGDIWDESGPFTRFKTRLYIFLMGVVMLWGPVMVFASRKPTGYAMVIGLFIMLVGLGFLIHAGTV